MKALVPWDKGIGTKKGTPTGLGSAVGTPLAPLSVVLAKRAGLFLLGLISFKPDIFPLTWASW